MGAKAGLERRHGHRKGGDASWRTYGRPRHAKAPAAPQESYWTKYATGERRDTEFQAEAERLHPSATAAEARATK